MHLPSIATRLLLGALCCLSPLTPAHAHHEAIFGPQSTLLMSSPSFLSLQAFTRRTGAKPARRQETTMLVSAGFQPLGNIPLGVTAVLPVSYDRRIDQDDGDVILESAIVGLRYRLDLEPLRALTGKTGNFLLATTALALPTAVGGHDHRSGSGLDAFFGALGSVEAGAISAIGYGFYRANTGGGPDRPGDALFTGAGVAWTPIEDERTHGLLSFQLGLGFERYAADRASGSEVATSGGRQLMAHPTVAWSPGGHWLLFALVSLPLWRDFADPDAAHRWRAGAGVLHAFSH